VISRFASAGKIVAENVSFLENLYIGSILDGSFWSKVWTYSLVVGLLIFF